MLTGTISVAPAPARVERKPADTMLRGALFSLLVAAAPVLIVMLSPPRSGGIFVAGYLAGTFTAPLVLLGTLKAAQDLFGSDWPNSVFGVLLYLSAVVLLSLAAIVWSFVFMT
jgi:hypothetical protein